MNKTLAISFCLSAFAALTPTASAKSAPLEAPDPGRGIIGMKVKVIPPAKIGSMPASTVLFVRVVDDADRFGADSLIPSNYAKGDSVYLLNAKPGRYVAVGCKIDTATVGVNGFVGPAREGVAVFSQADIAHTEVEVHAGAAVFMGNIVTGSSTKTQEADAAQAHYLHMISPVGAGQSFMARAFTGHYMYTATFKSIERGEAAEKEFWDEAIADHFKHEPAWAGRIAGGSGAPVGVAAASRSAGGSAAASLGATSAVVSSDDFLSGVCVDVNAAKARANGRSDDAESIARLACQTVKTDWDSRGCRESPDQDPCRKRLASLDGSLKSSGSSMLFAAAQAGQTSICSVMIAMGSDPNAAVASGSTPLRIAAENGHADIVELLQHASAAHPGPEPSAPDADPVKELEGEIEAGFVKLDELNRYLAKFEAAGSVSDEQLAGLDRDTRAALGSDAQPGETQDQKIERLTRSRDLLLYVLNDNASSGAEKYHQTPPPPVTVDTLRAAANKMEP